MEKDLKIIRDILKNMNYTDTYSDMLINKIIERFEESGLDSLTPNLVYYSLLNNEGKKIASDISDRYQRKRDHDDNDSPLQKWARERGYDN